MKKQPFLLSLFDYTGAWAKPFSNAGWKVMLWDKQVEGNLLERLSWIRLLIEEEQGEAQIDGLLAAPPCTDFAGSGAMYWPERDSGERWWPDIDENDWERLYFDTSTELSITLVEAVLLLKDWLQPRFWVIENPKGRLDTLVPELQSYRRMNFDPCDYGDPYTKKTILWGEFNTNLKRKPVEPEFVIASNGDRYSKMHWHTPGRGEKTKIIRSTTPAGFAKAFYEANHDWTNPQLNLFEK